MGGGDAGLHLRHEQVQHLGREPARAAHALEILGAVQRDREMGPLGGLEGVGFGHEGHHGPDIILMRRFRNP